MALKLPTIGETFDLVLSVDDAIDMTPEEHEAYVEGGCDPALLKVKEGMTPTKLTLRKVLPYKLAAKVQNAQLGFDEGDDLEKLAKKGKKPNLKVNMAFMLEEVRCAIVGVKDGDGLTFEAASDGGASQDFIARLHAAGVALEIYNALQTVASKSAADLKKK